MKKFFIFIISILISFIPSFVGMAFSPNGEGADMWYNMLNKSVLTPDGWVFAVVWPILFVLLGIALYLIITDTKTKLSKAKAYWLFVAHMVLNALWTYLFFGAHLVGLALVELFVLFGFSIWMARAFYQIRHSAGHLVIPYIVWQVFAMFLNGMILYLN